MKVDPQFLRRLAAEVRRRVGPVKPLRRDLERLHEGFTRSRKSRPRDYLSDDGARRAYLASFTVPNAARALVVLGRAGAGLNMGDRGLDVGTGTGSSALALAAHSHPDSTIVLTDRSGPALDVAQELFASLFPDGPRVEVVKLDLLPGESSLPKGRFRTVVCAHVLNEMLPPRGRDPGLALALALRLAERTADRLVFTEPAQRVPSLALCRVRDALIRKELSPVGPCTHAAACPVLDSNAKDWCVTDIPFDRPDIVREIDGLLGTDRRRLTVSWLALARGGRPPGGRVHEVLSEIMPARKSFLIYLCGERGRVVAKLPRPPAKRLLRGSHVLIPADAKPAGRDRTGAPLLPLAPGDLEPSDQP